MCTEKFRALGQVTAGVAHDLNNTLEAILVYADLLRMQVKLPEVQRALQVLYTAAPIAARWSDGSWSSAANSRARR